MDYETAADDGEINPDFTGSASASASTTRGLAGHWKMNNSDADSGIFGNTLSRAGGASYSTAQKREGTHSLLFASASSQEATFTISNTGLESHTNASTVDGFTVSCWFYRNSASSNAGLSSTERGPSTQTTSGYQWYFPGAGSVLQFNIRKRPGGSVTSLNSAVTVSLSTWTHAAVTVDYINGKIVSIVNGTIEELALSDVDQYTVDADQTFSIGSLIGFGYFDGYIDDFRFYNYPLTNNELEDLYRPVLVHYKFDETKADSSGAADDLVDGDGATGTVYSTVAIQGTHSLSLTGNVGTADKYHYVGSNSLGQDFLNSSEKCGFTTEAWIRYPVLAQTTETITGTYTASEPNNTWEIRYTGTGTNSLEFAVYGNTGTELVTSITGVDLAADTWYHLGTTFRNDGSVESNIYLNGVQRGVTGTSGIYSQSATGTSNRLTIGCRDPTANSGDGDQHFTGLLDNYRLYRCALSKDQMQVLGGGLIGHWTFDSTLASDTARGTTLEFATGATGATVYSTTNYRRGTASHQFDGATIYQAVDDNYGRSLCNSTVTTGFTVAVWLRWSSTNAATGLVGNYRNTSSNNNSFYFYYSSNELRFNVLNNASTSHQATATATYSSGEWIHLVGVCDFDAGTVTAYVNGAGGTPINLTGSFTQNSTSGIDGRFRIGAVYNGSSTYADIAPSGTQLDDVRLYDRVLTQDEIDGLWKRTDAIYQFNETLVDSQEYQNTFTVSGTGSASYDNVTFIEGVTSYDLNGSDNYLQATGTLANHYTNSDILDGFTISLWFYADTLASGEHDLISIRPTSSTLDNIIVIYTSTTTLNALIAEDGGSLTTANPASSLSTATWYHIVMLVDYGTANVTCYLNNAAGTPASITVSNYTQSTQFNKNIGWWDNGAGGLYFTNGKIDDVRFYDRPLTTGEITSLYNSGSAYIGRLSTRPEHIDGDTVDAANIENSKMLAKQAFDTTLSNINAADTKSWLALSATSERLIIDLGASTETASVEIVNFHNEGRDTDKGVKNFLLYSANSSPSTTYGNLTGLTAITPSTSTITQHPSTNTESAQTITWTSTTARYYVFDFTDGYATDYMGVRSIKLNGTPTVAGEGDTITKRHTSGVDISTSSIKIDTPGLYEIEVLATVDVTADNSNNFEWKLYENNAEVGDFAGVTRTAKTPMTPNGVVVTFLHTTTQYNSKLELYLRSASGSPSVTLYSRIINVRKVDLVTGNLPETGTGSTTHREAGWLVLYEDYQVTMSSTAQNLFEANPTASAVVTKTTSNVSNPATNDGITLGVTGTYLFEFTGNHQTSNATGSTYTLDLRADGATGSETYTLSDSQSMYNLVWVETVSSTGTTYSVYGSGATSTTGVNWMHRSFKTQLLDTTNNSNEWGILRTRSTTAVTDISTATNLFDLLGSESETMDTPTYTSGLGVTGGSRAIPINKSGLYNFDVGIHLADGSTSETLQVQLFEDGTLVLQDDATYQGAGIRQSFTYPVKITGSAKSYEVRVKTTGATSATFYGRWFIARELEDQATGLGSSTIDYLVLGNDKNVVPGPRSVIVGPGSSSTSLDKKAPDNTFIGADNAPKITTGQTNTIGGSSNAQNLTTGSNHCLYGVGVGNNLVAGNDCCLFGSGANTSGDGTNRLAFGTNATCSADNSMQIGNSSVTAMTVGSGSATVNGVTFSSSGVDGPIFVNGQSRLSFTSVSATGSSYSIASSDNVILVDSSSATGDINLPAASAAANRVVTIKDKGNAGTNNITVTSDGSNDIEGSATYTISTNYGVESFLSDGSEWYRL